MNNFGGKQNEQAPLLQESIQKQREVEEKLKKQIEDLKNKIAQEAATAKEYETKISQLATQAAKRQKDYEKQLNQTEGKLANLKNQRQSLENAQKMTDTGIVKLIGQTKEGLESARRINDEKMRNLKDEIAAGHERANEIAEVMSKPIGMRHGVNKDELEAQRKQLVQEETDEKLSVVGPKPVASRPEAPTGKPSRASRRSTRQEPTGYPYQQTREAEKRHSRPRVSQEQNFWDEHGADVVVGGAVVGFVGLLALVIFAIAKFSS